jgi:hypothetical protein
MIELRDQDGVLLMSAGTAELRVRCANCASLEAQNTGLDRALVDMEHALNEADVLMYDDDKEANAWRKRWGHLWARKA